MNFLTSSEASCCSKLVSLFPPFFLNIKKNFKIPKKKDRPPPIWQRDSGQRLRRSESPIKRIIENFESLNPLRPSPMASGSGSGNNNDDRNDRNDNDNNGVVNQRARSLREYLQPTRTTTPSCMVVPPNVGNFEIKPGVIQLLPKFHGLDSESAYSHLREFEEVCATLRFNNIGEDIVKFRLFPFSFKESENMVAFP